MYLQFGVSLWKKTKTFKHILRVDQDYSTHNTKEMVMYLYVHFSLTLLFLILLSLLHYYMQHKMVATVIIIGYHY